MDLSHYSRKEVGALGESVAAEYLRRNDFTVVERNVFRKTGELDIVANRRGVLHVVEVKSIVCNEFPPSGRENMFDPTDNLHPAKLRKVSRTGQWYVAEKKWEGEWQIDGIVVWLRRRDGLARAHYLPHIV